MQYDINDQCTIIKDTTVAFKSIQYSTVHYSTVQYSTVQYSTVQYSTVHMYITHDTHVHTYIHKYVPYPAEVPEGKKGDEAWTDTGTGHRAFSISEYCCKQVLNSLHNDRNVYEEK